MAIIEALGSTRVCLGFPDFCEVLALLSIHAPQKHVLENVPSIDDALPPGKASPFSPVKAVITILLT
jgi:hypothetical protein